MRHAKAEETLRKDGEEKAVASQRVKSAAAISEQLTAVAEAETGRKVIGYMSASQQDPSLLCHVFVLEQADRAENDSDDEDLLEV